MRALTLQLMVVVTWSFACNKQAKIAEESVIGIGFVTDSSVKMRKKPQENAEIAALLPAWENVEILDPQVTSSSGLWYRVRKGATIGYLSVQELQKQSSFVEIRPDVNGKKINRMASRPEIIYEKPSRKAKVLKKLRRGHMETQTGTGFLVATNQDREQWVELEYAPGKTGYALDQFLLSYDKAFFEPKDIEGTRIQYALEQAKFISYKVLGFVLVKNEEPILVTEEEVRRAPEKHHNLFHGPIPLKHARRVAGFKIRKGQILAVLQRHYSGNKDCYLVESGHRDPSERKTAWLSQDDAAFFENHVSDSTYVIPDELNQLVANAANGVKMPRSELNDHLIKLEPLALSKRIDTGARYYKLEIPIGGNQIDGYPIKLTIYAVQDRDRFNVLGIFSDFLIVYTGIDVNTQSIHSIRTQKIADADFDGDGHPELILSETDYCPPQDTICNSSFFRRTESYERVMRLRSGRFESILYSGSKGFFAIDPPLIVDNYRMATNPYDEFSHQVLHALKLSQGKFIEVPLPQKYQKQDAELRARKSD